MVCKLHRTYAYRKAKRVRWPLRVGVRNATAVNRARVRRVEQSDYYAKVVRTCRVEVCMA